MCLTVRKKSFTFLISEHGLTRKHLEKLINVEYDVNFRDLFKNNMPRFELKMEVNLILDEEKKTNDEVRILQFQTCTDMLATLLSS